MNVAPAGPQLRTPGPSAFTLAEVLVAVAVMSVAFVSLYLGVSSAFAITQVSRENLRATQIMLERMEGIRLYNWNQLNYSNMIPGSFVEYYYPAATNGASRGVAYRGHFDLGPANLNPPANYEQLMRAITVTVFWTNSSGAGQPLVRQRSMRTYSARDGVQNYVIKN